jgi:hypothetical protein
VQLAQEKHARNTTLGLGVQRASSAHDTASGHQHEKRERKMRGLDNRRETEGNPKKARE